MSKRYPGNFITGNPVALSQTSNNGIWDVTDVSAAVAAGTWQEPDGIYEIPKSLRFRQSVSANLSRTPTVAGNRRTWTYSFWAKKTKSTGRLLYVGNGSNSETGIYFTGDRLQFEYYVAPTNYYVRTGRLLRDPSAWYHIVVVCDTTNSVTNDRMRLYVNGARQTELDANSQPTQNFEMRVNEAVQHLIGTRTSDTSTDLDAYLSELNFVDGQALDPSYFGYTNAITNIWQPKKYTGAYGTNGFYLPFSENLSTTNLGRNFAGSNHFTYSQAGTDASYVYNNASGTANFTTAPDGTLTATKLTIDSSNTTHRFYKQYSVLTSGAVAVVSAYVKALPGSLYNVVALESWTGSAGGQAYFNLSTGQPQYSAAWPAGSGFQYVGDGWYRIWTTFANATSNGSGSPSIGIYMADNSNGLTYTGNGTAGFYFWGVQANLGTTPDNYIATTSAASINNFTPSGISVTADSTYDSMVDSPTNVFTSATDVGGIVPGNYCTWNPIERPDTSGNAYAISLSNGNLTTTTTGSEGFSNNTTLGTFQIPTNGKWYWEILITNVATAAASRSHVGIMNQTAKNADGADFGYASAAGAYSYAADGQKSASPTHSLTSYGTSYTNGNTIGVAVDSDAGKIWFAKNNTWQASGDPVAGTNAAFTGLNMTGGFQPASGYHLGCTANFGQRPFTYTPPVGYKSLNTTNLQALGTAAVGNAAITPNKWFDINRYAGTGTARDIQNSGFQPDIVMVKKISGTDNFEITDSGRGDNLRMYPNTSEQESAGGISLRPDGFNLLPTFGTDNESGFSYIAWQWKQSPTSGLNIIPYTGTGVARTISHNLGVAPRFMWIKQRDVTNRSWCVYHEGLSNPQSAFYLDSSAAPFAYTAFFNNTAPSSSNFSLGTDASVNQNNSKYIAYLWAEVPGFSKFGSYAGTGSADGPFIYLGFKPRWILVRYSNLSTGALRDWLIYDSARTLYNGYNYSDTRAGTQAIISGVPYTGSSGYSDSLDFVSNGFKFKNGASPNFNASGETYVYAAFAESPFALNNRAI